MSPLWGSGGGMSGLYNNASPLGLGMRALIPNGGNVPGYAGNPEGMKLL